MVMLTPIVLAESRRRFVDGEHLQVSPENVVRMQCDMGDLELRGEPFRIDSPTCSGSQETPRCSERRRIMAWILMGN